MTTRLASTGKKKQSLKTKPMLSIEQCRKLIADKNLTDEEVEQVRDELYILANLAFDHWQKTKALKKAQAKEQG